MPDITDPSAVRHCNERIRPAANAVADLYYTAKQAVDEWYANDLASTIPNTTDEVADGADGDGRKPITGQKVHNIINRLTAFVDDMEADANAKLNTVLQVSTRN